ncbi:PREDICTED: alpha-1,6-mannosyl-glycoprotein 2-beta-N-acetylglucosaminyltransferase [Charadrius vociferus]|uniref:alpha-1,6-mannosyl-glycoprotein 2-beta-N-acetylglucosaminyltransferase n=1 Tax=Charadrius vociferus TaxID=50402 RepID=UPI0005216C1A|nr:PREDICTED: alpha-1,6-mannosyl-glycoprotein 2-beta-N-acetylglucosaminyltransferase [Charadrius vociferus]
METCTGAASRCHPPVRLPEGCQVGKAFQKKTGAISARAKWSVGVELSSCRGSQGPAQVTASQPQEQPTPHHVARNHHRIPQLARGHPGEGLGHDLNRLAARVDFCPVLQVFFPFSIQLYPREFPGHDPRDCPRDVGKAAALRLGCINAEYPDSFGHYREARFSQTKHHWWWKLHFVWERVRALREHAGPVLFLEEDHYLAPDFYHVLKKLWALRERECPECQIVSLGTYSPIRGGFAGRADKVEMKTWKSTEHNMGMAFGRDTYQKLIECTDAFCTYDDYNWDWTLQHLTVSCLPKFWKVLVPEIPRIFHTGDCGMHHKKSCRPSTQSAKIDSLLNSNQQYLFPETMSVSKRYSMAPLSPHVKNGGWGDIRDHELCKSYRRLQ